MLNFRGRNRATGENALEVYAGTIEQILTSVGIDPVRARMRTETGFGWSFQRNSAVIEIFVSQQDGVGYLQVLSPIMHLPINGLLPLYRRLLELNLQLTNAALGVYLDVVYVFNERPLEGLDGSEANTIINLVASYADDLDDKLVQEFGGRLYAKV
ncbi:MAG: YbjN domain-containing protein [Chloroflexi bacterium]|nr:YbjN domain-containing protein [Chloroflexota bacterium]MCC6895871.1 YbjN domain-containing protein [Anaerolineae bacterium]